MGTARMRSGAVRLRADRPTCTPGPARHRGCAPPARREWPFPTRAPGSNAIGILARASLGARRRRPATRPPRGTAPHRAGRPTPSWPPHSRTALSMRVSRTGWRSVGERLMTLRISLVAVCCSSASFGLSSWNSRTFSMAITAWAAKVSRSSICLSVNGRPPRRGGDRADRAPSRSMGTARRVRKPRLHDAAGCS